MDNNFNQQAPQQQMPQQPVYQQVPQQQMPQQQMYQQAPQQQMYQQPMYQQPVPKKPSNVNTTELIALILSSVGTLMAVIGSIMTCSCSASKSLGSNIIAAAMSGGKLHRTHGVMFVAILGAFVAAAGVFMAIMALKQKDAAIKAGKLSYIAMAVGVFGVIYGILPVLTICGYNCSLNSKMKM